MASLTTLRATPVSAGPVRSPRARRCSVRIETESGVYVGKVYVPHGRGRVSDVLVDDRAFLSLTDVTCNESATIEAYVAINKRHIRTLRILDEADEGQSRLVKP